MKLKIAVVDAYNLRDAYSKSAGVLRRIKTQQLTGDALEFMKILESGVQTLEVVVMHLKRKGL